MIRVIELFSGIGSQHAALERLGIPYQIVGMAEIDKYAIKSYEAIHGATHNYGDISKIDRLGKADFWTYSFPCQDISVAGKQRGINEGTRSGLLYEVERLLEVAKEYDELPTYLMLENVKNLVGKKFKPDFDKWIGKLNELGYNTYWKVLNAKHYGVPQNRERVFAISIKREFDMGYQFPEGFDNGIRLKDILEKEVDEKFYISGEKVEKLVSQIGKPKNFDESENTYGIKRIGNIYGEDKGTGFAGNVWDKDYISPTIMTAQGGNRQPMIVSVGNINPSGNGMNGNVISSEGLAPTLTTNKGEGQKILELGKFNENRHSSTPNSILSVEGICPTIDTMQGGNRQPKVLSPQATTKGYIECSVPGVFDMTYPDSKTRRGRVQDHGEIVPTLTAASQDIMYIEPSGIYSGDSEKFNRGPLEGLSRTLKANKHDACVIEPEIIQIPRGNNNGGNHKVCPTITSHSFQDNNFCNTGYRIRKLTPLECFRLMGFTDEEFYKAQAVNSNSQLYKQAGNSIVVDVLYHLFKNLFVNQEESTMQLSLF